MVLLKLPRCPGRDSCRILPALSDSPLISLSLTLSSPSDRAGVASPHPSDGGSAAYSGSQQIYGSGV